VTAEVRGPGLNRELVDQFEQNLVEACYTYATSRLNSRSPQIDVSSSNDTRGGD
jgi:hypothetical protein